MALAPHHHMKVPPLVTKDFILHVVAAALVLYFSSSWFSGLLVLVLLFLANIVLSVRELFVHGKKPRIQLITLPYR